MATKQNIGKPALSGGGFVHSTAANAGVSGPTDQPDWQRLYEAQVATNKALKNRYRCPHCHTAYTDGPRDAVGEELIDELVGALRVALQSLEASMGRMDECHYLAALEDKLPDNPLRAIDSARAALAKL